ncbi:Chymotrypsinogen A [Trichinella spiralis]|uniref:Chymotrypsinogen A n=1 Tax=Trichinella spiralis TaxID=6334 RepID=A0A0V1BDD7_TRISP|nr:Chymotrypsinogen A [Trichinella spiralis]
MKRCHYLEIFFYHALLIFCIIIKKTFSEECGKPYFEPYLTNPPHISGFWYESCGGSLISFDYSNASDTVLTSSHCVRQSPRGCECNNRDSRCIRYKGFKRTSQSHIKSPCIHIPHSHYISSVCLPYPFQEIPYGETCFLSGWGFTRGRPLSELRQVGIPILRSSNCRFTDAYDIFCAGDMGEGNYSFQIDSGGPLVCKLNDSYVQIGIVSFGYNHAGKHHPGIYSKVPYYLNWIYNQLSWLPDSFNSSDIGGEESDCPDDCYHPWRSVFKHFKHRKASFRNRPPYSHSHRPTMNENRPPPPPDSQNFAMQLCGIVIL